MLIWSQSPRLGAINSCIIDLIGDLRMLCQLRTWTRKLISHITLHWDQYYSIKWVVLGLGKVQHDYSLCYVILRSRLFSWPERALLPMIPPVQQWTSPDWNHPVWSRSSPRYFWTRIGQIPNLLGPGLNWPGLLGTGPLGQIGPNTLGVTDTFSHQIDWYTYTHTCRLILPFTSHNALITPHHLPLATHPGGNISTSINSMSHISMENSSDTCARRHCPAFQPIAFPTFFQSSRCRYFHRLPWWRRYSRVWSSSRRMATLL